jgi:hypothetical protein
LLCQAPGRFGLTGFAGRVIDDSKFPRKTFLCRQ